MTAVTEEWLSERVALMRRLGIRELELTGWGRIVLDPAPARRAPGGAPSAPVAEERR